MNEPAPPPSNRRRLRVSATAVGLTTLAAAVAVVIAQNLDSADRPSPRDGEWRNVHDAHVARAKEGNIDLLFLGDSITQYWDGQPEVWERYYGTRRAAHFGIGGDSTQHLLWRLDHGEIDGIKPKVVVLLIGTNNLASHSPAAIAAGITAAVARLRAQLPDSQILLLALFPRSPLPDDPDRLLVRAVNTLIRRLDDGSHVHYLDLGPHFLNPDGTLSEDVMPDSLHLSREGYVIWAESMEPTLQPLLREK